MIVFAFLLAQIDNNSNIIPARRITDPSGYPMYITRDLLLSFEASDVRRLYATVSLIFEVVS